MRQVRNVQSFVFILPAVLISSLFMHSNEILDFEHGVNVKTFSFAFAHARLCVFGIR